MRKQRNQGQSIPITIDFTTKEYFSKEIIKKIFLSYKTSLSKKFIETSVS